jgi:hypothetical protein
LPIRAYFTPLPFRRSLCLQRHLSRAFPGRTGTFPVRDRCLHRKGPVPSPEGTVAFPERTNAFTRRDRCLPPKGSMLPRRDRCLPRRDRCLPP